MGSHGTTIFFIYKWCSQICI